MMTEQEFDDMNMKIPQAIQYLVDTNKTLLNEVQELRFELTVYKQRYTNEVQLRQSLLEQKDKK